MDPLISLRDVGVRYRRSGSILRRGRYHEALKSINLDIYPGQTLGIMGRNGSGKSTLLRVIAGVLRPDTGEVINRGVSVSLLSLNVGFDPNLSGRDNAIISGMLQGGTRREMEGRLGEILDFSELGDFFDEPLRTYSSGMRARLGFSVAMTVNPDVLLLDEALAVGDALFREKAERAMFSLLRSRRAVVLVSHSQEMVDRLCDTVVEMRKGEGIPPQHEPSFGDAG